MTFYEKFYKTFKPLVMKVFRVHAEGLENIPEGGVILAANHTSLSDVVIISAASNRQVRYMAKKELFRIPLLAPLIRALGAYSVDRGGSDVGSLKKTMALIREGELVGIFPQGHRQPKQNPRQTEIKPGVGMIAYRTEAQVLPVWVGNARMKTGLFRKNTVIFGKPVPFEDLGFTEGGREEYAAVSRRIFDRVCDLHDAALPPPEERT